MEKSSIKHWDPSHCILYPHFMGQFQFAFATWHTNTCCVRFICLMPLPPSVLFRLCQSAQSNSISILTHWCFQAWQTGAVQNYCCCCCQKSCCQKRGGPKLSPTKRPPFHFTNRRFKGKKRRSKTVTGSFLKRCGPILSLTACQKDAIQNCEPKAFQKGLVPNCQQQLTKMMQ